MADSRKTHSERETEYENSRPLARSELNLELNRIFAGLDRGRMSREFVERETLPSGETIERRVIVGKAFDGVEVGDLTPYHFLVCLALEELWTKAGKPVNDVVPFTTLKLMKRLGMKDSGQEYARIKAWLRGLRQRPISFINAFYNSEDGDHVDLNDITVLSHLRFYERKYTTVKGVEKRRGYGEFQFDRYILNSLINNYTHPVHLDVATSFKKNRERAILLYTYLDRNLTFRDKYEIGLEKLFDHLGWSQEYVRYPSDRKKKADAVVREMIDTRLSSGGHISYCRVHKTKDGKSYKLVAHKRRGQPKSMAEQDEVVPRQTPKDSNLHEKLAAHGLTHTQIEHLSEAGEHAISTQLEALPHRVESYERKQESPNQAALLYQSIKENWALPKSYLDAKERAEREAKAQHFILWSCRNIIDECPYSRKTMSSPRGKGAPEQCPHCNSSIEIMKKDHVVYPQ